MKRSLSLLLALVMVLLCLPTLALAEGEVVPMRYVIPGSGPSIVEGEKEKAFAKLNEKLLADGVGIEFQLTTIPWDAWDQKTTLMLASGESFDMLHVMEDQKGFSSYVSQEALYPLDDLLAQYGSHILQVIPEAMMAGGKVNGQTYCVPAFWTETTEAVEAVTMRTDWVKAYGLETPKTAEDLVEVCKAFSEKWPGDGKPYVLQLYTEPARYLYRTMESYPFTVFEQLICIRQDGKVEAWIDTPEFEAEARYARNLFDLGLVNPDILSVPSDWRNNEAKMGRYLYRDGTGVRTLADSAKEGVEEDLILLAPEKNTFRDMAFRNDNVVPASSEHPEAAIKFLDWLYTSQENYDLFIYGIEGEQYNIVDAEARTYENVKDAEGNNLYQFDTWMIGNLSFARANSTTHPSVIRTAYVYDTNAGNSVAMGFQFDPSDVSVEYANCLAEVKAALYPMKVGIQAYDDGIAAAKDGLKAAGIDAVVAEYTSQFEAWRAANAG